MLDQCVKKVCLNHHSHRLEIPNDHFNLDLKGTNANRKLAKNRLKIKTSMGCLPQFPLKKQVKGKRVCVSKHSGSQKLV